MVDTHTQAHTHTQFADGAVEAADAEELVAINYLEWLSGESIAHKDRKQPLVSLFLECNLCDFPPRLRYAVLTGHTKGLRWRRDCDSPCSGHTHFSALHTHKCTLSGG